MDLLPHKKPRLPHGWVVETSKTYPDRVYYFNCITGAASWNCPQLLSDANSSDQIKPSTKMENNKTAQEADTSSSVDCAIANPKPLSESSSQLDNDFRKDDSCKKRITFSETITSTSSVCCDIQPNLALDSASKKDRESVSSKSGRIVKKRLKRPVFQDTCAPTSNLTQSKRVILKAKRHTELAKTEHGPSKRSPIHFSRSNTSVLSRTSPKFKSHVDEMINNKIVNLKASRSKFRRTQDQKSSLLNNDLSGASSAATNESFNQDVEMPDLSELLTCNTMPEPMQTEETPFENGLYIVVDTNVFLYSLKYIENLIETSYEDWGYPNIRIPWAVIQELDALKNHKNGKSNGIVHKAADAVRFVYKMLQCKHPRLRGQTAADANKTKGDLNAECNDDKILQCCIQLAETVGKKNVILLTEDKNLCNKAFINDIDVHTLKTLQKELKVHDALENTSEEAQNPPYCNIKELSEVTLVDAPDPLKEQRKHQLEDAVNEAQLITKNLLSSIVETEMKEAFGTMWEKIVIKKPPWTLLAVLECLHRHWIAVFGFLFQHDMKKACEDLSSLLKCGLHDPANEHEITKMFEFASTICTCIYVKYGSELADKSLNQLEEIKNRWQTLYRNESELLNVSQADECENIVFSSFNYVWTVINHTCGIIQDSLNFQCNIMYERPSFLPSQEEIIQLIPKVHKKLQEMDKEMNIIITSAAKDNYYKKAIFEFLVTFRTFSDNLNIQLPEFPTLKLVTPEMLEEYCTDTSNKEKLLNGHCQLKHFLSTIERIARYVSLKPIMTT